MGIFTRFRDIVNSNINSMLDGAEDPDKMIKLMIREMEDTLIEIKSSCAGLIASRKKVQRRLDEMIERRELWARRSELAVARGSDDLAREALIEKKHFAELSESLAKEVFEHQSFIQQYQDDIAELEKKLGVAKEKKRTLSQRHKKAQNKKRAQEDIRRMDSSETMARFEYLENRIERMEAEADMVNFGKPDPDERFDDLATDDEIEKELAKMKAAAYRDKKEDLV